MSKKLKAIRRMCLRCGVGHYMVLPRKDWVAWKRGDGLIQDLMPYLSADIRELLISGICGPCFDEKKKEDL